MKDCDEHVSFNVLLLGTKNSKFDNEEAFSSFIVSISNNHDHFLVFFKEQL